MIKQKGYASKNQIQSEETAPKQQTGSPLDKILSQAERAYAAYLEAQREVAQAYHENEIQVNQAYRRDEEKIHKTYHQVMREALRVREASIEEAQEVLRETEEKINNRYKEVIAQALEAREDVIDKAWAVYQKAKLSALDIYSRLAEISHNRTLTDDEIYLQNIASAFKEELDKPLNADHFVSIQNFPNENQEMAKRMLFVQRKASDIRSKD
ncbi:MAG: hypothetical protein C4555_02120 [Dehalococcoidia bacterium]|nr:MAG: hypothetical protein C4555_02120 [Dehalococcoidia bacterium]